MSHVGPGMIRSRRTPYISPKSPREKYGQLTYPLLHIKRSLVIIFAMLNCMSHYWQLEVEPDIETMAFTCSNGLFEFVQMTFGLEYPSQPSGIPMISS